MELPSAPGFSSTNRTDSPATQAPLSDKVYVGVMAQEVQSVRPEAVMRGHDGYLWVNYDMLGLRRMTWDQWVASGKKIPAPTTRH